MIFQAMNPIGTRIFNYHITKRVILYYIWYTQVYTLLNPIMIPIVVNPMSWTIGKVTMFVGCMLTIPSHGSCSLGLATFHAYHWIKSFEYPNISTITRHTVDGCELLHQLIPSFWWCRISQPSTVDLKLGLPKLIIHFAIHFTRFFS